MFLSSLTVHNFRNYEELSLSLSPGLFIFYGENAQGKTNLLEAVSLLATATSFHASSDREVVRWQAPDHVAHLKGYVHRSLDEAEVEITIFDPSPPTFTGTPIDQSFELPANAPRKRVKLNGTPKRTMDVIGQLKVVLFAPADLHLVDGSPEERRRFLDRSLCQINPRYCQALVRYRKVVTQRSALLKRIRDYQEDPGLLEYLDEQLTSLANLLMFERQRMITALNTQAEQLQTTISGGREHLQILYRPSFKVEAGENMLDAPQHYRSQLQVARKKELHQGVCLYGPHRDDLEFIVNDMNIQTYGSRGQQRTVALSTKLAELSYMRSHTGDEPILLLDDVFSELDTMRRQYLLQQISTHEQVLVTTTNLTDFPPEILSQAHIYSVHNGSLTKEN